MTLVYIIIATIGISMASLVGIFFISIREELLKRILTGLVTFATGILLGGAILHLLPEAFEADINAPFWILCGIFLFFILERFLFWRHCHDGVCDAHPIRYLNLIGDGLHNFIDGTVIGAAFVADVKLGVTISIIALAHEIPQEIGDFAILVYGGFSRRRALVYNLICATTCIIGGIMAYFFSTRIENLAAVLLAFAGGNFLYIAMVDLLPEFRKVEAKKGLILQFILFGSAIFFMWVLKLAH